LTACCDGSLPADAKLRSSKYLNNLIEQDHRGALLQKSPNAQGLVGGARPDLPRNVAPPIFATEPSKVYEVAAKTVLKAATAAVPRRRYAVGKMARQVSFLRRFVPASAFDKCLHKQMRLPVLKSGWVGMPELGHERR
jgi:hypothetical protein